MLFGWIWSQEWLREWLSRVDTIDDLGVILFLIRVFLWAFSHKHIKMLLSDDIDYIKSYVMTAINPTLRRHKASFFWCIFVLLYKRHTGQLWERGGRWGDDLMIISIDLSPFFFLLFLSIFHLPKNRLGQRIIYFHLRDLSLSMTAGLQCFGWYFHGWIFNGCYFRTGKVS